MKKNFLLLLAILIVLILVSNSIKKIISFRGTSALVEQEEQKLARLKRENENLKRDLEYKQSERFVEGEIRNKLGLAKEGEEIVVVPGKESDLQQETSSKKSLSNWRKWKKLFFGRA